MSIVKGVEGQILIKTDNVEEEVPFAEQWQASLNTQQVDAGPFLNDSGRRTRLRQLEEFRDLFR